MRRRVKPKSRSLPPDELPDALLGMFAQDFADVLDAQTPTKHTDNTFLHAVQERLVRFIRCADIDITFQVRQEFLQLKHKMERANLDGKLEHLLKPAARKLAVSCEFYELMQAQGSVQNELEQLNQSVFEIAEQKLAASSGDASFQVYTDLKNRVDPLKASMQFLPLRIECFKMDALQWFPESVNLLETEQYKLLARVKHVDTEFSRLDALFHSLAAHKPVEAPAQSIATVSSIPVMQLRLRGQRKSQPPRFASMLPKPTEVKSRPLSESILRHRRSSSQWSSVSSVSSDCAASPPKVDTSRPRILDQAPLVLEPLDIRPRPKSRLMRPTPIELPKRQKDKEKENVEEPGFSRIPISARRNVLSTISENASAIPKHHSVLRARRSTAHLYNH